MLVTRGQFTIGLEAFAAEGYDVSWEVVSAWNLLLQNSERVYIVGIRAEAAADHRNLVYQAR